MTSIPPPDDDTAWTKWQSAWSLRPDTVYLNHGSFGPPPDVVRAARRRWIDRLDEQPMEYFIRDYEDLLRDAREKLTGFVGAGEGNLIFVEHATMAMNILAGSFPLGAGDEVLLTDHEYGAVNRIWDRACEQVGARRITATLPARFTSSEEVVEAIFRKVTDRTRLIVVSHVTSPTAIILPVEQICRRARQQNVRVCIDGPHAVAMLPLDLAALDCDYFTASCHKWLCAPFGSGFFYVHPRVQQEIKPLAISWGRSPPLPLDHWGDEFIWTGTRDQSALLTIPTAIDFLRGVPFDAFRARYRYLIRYAREQVTDLTGLAPYVGVDMDDEAKWCGSMIALPLSPGEARPLQQALWQRHRIEIPVIDWHGGRHVRVSCHLYNTTQQIDRLVDALRELLRQNL